MISGVGALDFKSLSGPSPLAGEGLTAGAANPANSFANVLADLATRTVGTLQNAEQLSVKGLQGDVDTRAVVDAVMNAEQALQAAVAIRDKIVTAYMEISRMAI